MASKQKSKQFNFTDQQPEGAASAPRILGEYQQKAWEVYQSLPFPTLKDEAWRRTSLRSLDLESFQLSNGKQRSDGEAKIPDQLLRPVSAEDSGGQALISPEGVTVTLEDGLAAEGLIFTDLKTAAAEHPQLLEKIMGSTVPPEEGKFAALTAAYGDKGLFLYVPRNMRVDKPLHSLTWASGSGQALFSQLLIYLEEGASLDYIHESSSPGETEKESFLGENVEIVLGKNARLTLADLQTLGTNVWSIAHKNARLERDAHLDWVMGELGSKLNKHFISVDLDGEGAEGQVSALFFAGGGQHLSFNTRQNHNAPHTNSDLLFKGALKEDGRSVWRGMIYVAPGARNIDGYQANRNMILSDQARSDSIPGLEILNNDVRCTHGSTVGKIDREQLFYLQARGIPREQAEQLILQGFFEVIFGRIPYQSIQDRLWSLIEQKLNLS
ncbi:MAG: Fe-S cluster assembly protein SufD [Anaerolineales bacterium]|nr:Fe-S cluster assembly protein SufD [Anaerolineales bacterium]